MDDGAVFPGERKVMSLNGRHATSGADAAERRRALREGQYLGLQWPTDSPAIEDVGEILVGNAAGSSRPAIGPAAGAEVLFRPVEGLGIMVDQEGHFVVPMFFLRFRSSWWNVQIVQQNVQPRNRKVQPM